MPVKVIVSLDKIKNPNCGLGRVSIDFSRALIKLNDNEIELSFLVYGKSEKPFLKNQPVKRMRFFHRYVPFRLGGFQIFHVTHQLPSFKTKGAGKIILTIHDLNFLHSKSKPKAEKYLQKVQQNVDRADAIVFVSKYTKDECLKFLSIPAHKKICVIYNGVELPEVEPVKPALFSEGKYLFSIGQFLAKKNFHVLIPFLKKLSDDIKLIIAGENDTTYGDYMRNLIIENGLQQRIILPGPVSEAEKLFLYRHCTAFVFPSLAEGFGLPVLEAMRAGKPVFCSDKTSLKEIGSQYVHFWESFDPDLMVQFFNAGITNFTEVKSKEAYNYSLNFTWAENAKEYIRLYKSLPA
jgi:glycosyltransferase involved in cell wall biosynthesis